MGEQVNGVAHPPSQRVKIEHVQPPQQARGNHLLPRRRKAKLPGFSHAQATKYRPHGAHNRLSRYAGRREGVGVKTIVVEAVDQNPVVAAVGLANGGQMLRGQRVARKRQWLVALAHLAEAVAQAQVHYGIAQAVLHGTFLGVRREQIHQVRLARRKKGQGSLAGRRVAPERKAIGHGLVRAVPDPFAVRIEQQRPRGGVGQAGAGLKRIHDTIGNHLGPVATGQKLQRAGGAKIPRVVLALRVSDAWAGSQQPNQQQHEPAPLRHAVTA